MKRYTFKVKYFEVSSAEKLERFLCQLGDDGWSMISCNQKTCNMFGGGSFSVVMQRELAEDEDIITYEETDEEGVIQTFKNGKPHCKVHVITNEQADYMEQIHASLQEELRKKNKNEKK
jgi:hypothetical protein